MNPLQNESKEQSNLWAFLNKVLRLWFCADWTPEKPDPPKSPQDYRDETLSKCPWKDGL